MLRNHIYLIYGGVYQGCKNNRGYTTVHVEALN